MRLATIRDGHGTRAVRVDGDQLVDLGVADVGALLRLDGWPDIAARAGSAAGTTRPAAGAEFAAPVVHPGRSCVWV